MSTSVTRSYARAAGGTLWHVAVKRLQHGQRTMLCGMTATGRTSHGPSGRFDLREGSLRSWPKPRCAACEAKATGNPPPARFRPHVEVAFPDERGETYITVTVGKRGAMALVVKAQSNMVQIHGPVPTSEAPSPGIGRLSRYVLRSVP